MNESITPSWEQQSLKVVKVSVQDFNLLWSSILIPMYHSFVTYSDKVGCDLDACTVLFPVYCGWHSLELRNYERIEVSIVGMKRGLISQAARVIFKTHLKTNQLQAWNIPITHATKRGQMNHILNKTLANCDYKRYIATQTIFLLSEQRDRNTKQTLH